MQRDPIKVYLVDDQAMIRAGLRSILDERAGIRVVGEAEDARHALEEIQRLLPDVIVLDIAMPGLSGIDAIPLFQRALPRVKILMLSHHEGDTFVEQALRAGAEGYLSKASDPSEFVLALEAVHRGDPYVSPRVCGGLLASMRGGPGANGAGSRIDSLTRREREVFQLLAVGKSNKEVAHLLEISLGTAKKHRENLQRKLQCGSAAELARIAIQEGLLE